MIPQKIKRLDQTTLQVLIDALPDYVLLTNQSRNIVAVNQALASALGTDSERLLGESRFVAKDSSEGSADGFPLHEVLRTACGSEKEVYDAGTDSWMLVSAHPISMGAAVDEALCLYAIRYITHRKRITEELSRSLEQQNGLNLILRAVQVAQTPAQVLEAAIDHVLQVSWLGVRTSAAGFLLRGPQLYKVVNRNLPPVVEQGCAEVGLGKCLCGRVAKTGESIVCAHVDERHTPYEGMLDHGHVVLPLKWQSQILGVLCFYLAAGQELDDHRRNFVEAAASIVATAIGRLYYQSQLAQSERLSSVGLLAAGVAHEIKNPLGLVLTNVEWLVEDLPPILEDYRTLRERLIEELGAERANALMSGTTDLRDDELLQDMAQCTRSALDGVRRVGTIVRNLGTFSRADDDQLSRVSLVDVLERAVSLSQNEIKYRASISRDFRETPQVLAHEGRLTQVFLNLLINAAHAIDKGKPKSNEIQLRLWHEGEKVFAEVKDTGKGIHPADLPYVFEPFFTTKERGVGTGLGLYISNNIVTSLGGRLEVDSTVGRGTRFVLSLPVAGSLATGPPSTPADTLEMQDSSRQTVTP